MKGFTFPFPTSVNHFPHLDRQIIFLNLKGVIDYRKCIGSLIDKYADVLATDYKRILNNWHTLLES